MNLAQDKMVEIGLKKLYSEYPETKNVQVVCSKHDKRLPVVRIELYYQDRIGGHIDTYRMCYHMVHIGRFHYGWLNKPVKTSTVCIPTSKEYEKDRAIQEIIQELSSL